MVGNIMVSKNMSSLKCGFLNKSMLLLIHTNEILDSPAFLRISILLGSMSLINLGTSVPKSLIP